MTSFVSELKRRNVLRVAAAYAVKFGQAPDILHTLTGDGASLLTS